MKNGGDVAAHQTRRTHGSTLRGRITFTSESSSSAVASCADHRRGLWAGKIASSMPLALDHARWQGAMNFIDGLDSM
jgi:hypothetical protein